MMTPRLLMPNEIEARVGSINEKGATLLLYKDARVDMSLLDETYGAENWQRKHYELKGHIYCSVGIKEDGDWVWKDDVGTESNTEATKGESSDSFKRACFNWGIGRELYTAPFTWISADNYKGFLNAKGKWATYDKFSVSKIGYNDNREINELVIVNDNTGRVVFTLGKKIKGTTDTTTGGGDQEEESRLKKAKEAINAELEKQNYIIDSSKQAFVYKVLKKETIDSLDDAEIVMQQLENEA